MGMSFVKVYFDFEERTEMLNEVERGRLLLAMLRYAQGKEPPELRGGERFLFPVFKMDIDRDANAYASKVENGASGGRPSKPKETEGNRTKPNVTEGNRTKPEETERNRRKPNETEHNLILKNKNKNKEQEQEQEHSGDTRARARFTPPGLEAVEAYARERGWGPDVFSPERFVDFYGSKGWRVGKDPMRDWKAAARGWVSRQRQEASGGSPQREKDNPALNYEQREYRAEDFDEGFFVDLDRYGGEA